MNKTKLLEQLEGIADELKPLTVEVAGNTLLWNGVEYAKGVERKADINALMWWSMINVIVNLLEAQLEPLSTKQIDYLRKLMFGGMGSFQDAALNWELIESRGEAVAKRFDEKKSQLFAILGQ